MPKTQKIIQSFNAGELSELMDQRIDQQKYLAGCRTLENFLPLIYGGIERRPGTRYVGTTKSNGTARLKVFEYNIDVVYLLEFGNQYIRFYEMDSTSAYDTQYYIRTCHKTDIGIWVTATAYIIGDLVSIAGTPATYFRCIVNHTSGASHVTPPGNTTDWIAADNATDTDYAIYELVSPYLTADLFELKFEHSNDVMWITHPDYEPRRLSRIAHTNADQTVAFTLAEEGLTDGPFLDLNTDESITIAVTEIAAGGTAVGASVTLTASKALFTTGATAGHKPSGTTPTSKSLTGALFKIVQPLATTNVNKNFTAVSQTSSPSLLVYENVHWDFITNGTWRGQITLERSYDNTNWETVFTISSEKNANAKTDMVEDGGDAYYRMSSSLGAASSWSGTANCQISIRDRDTEGIVEITAVASTTSATATVVKSLNAAVTAYYSNATKTRRGGWKARHSVAQTVANFPSTVATSRWAEGYFSNKNGWPRCVGISPEERLTYAGSKNYPLTIWGSKIGEYTTFKEGTDDDDPVIFTLIGQGEQNAIRWMKSKDVILIGTVGGEHIIGASTKDKPLTPTNVKAKIQSTYGSADVDSLIVGDAILFVQRGGRKLRELRYSWESDSYDADNLTRFAEHITTSGIKEMAYQRVPEPMVWCVRDDGDIGVLCYDRKENVFAWSRIISAVTTHGDCLYKSVVVSSTSGEEDRVFVIVTRELESGVKNYIEYFSMRDYSINEDLKDTITSIDNTALNAFFVDSGITFVDVNGTNVVTGLDHLDGETVAVWGSREITV